MYSKVHYDITVCRSTLSAATRSPAAGTCLLQRYTLRALACLQLSLQVPPTGTALLKVLACRAPYLSCRCAQVSRRRRRIPHPQAPGRTRPLVRPLRPAHPHHLRPRPLQPSCEEVRGLLGISCKSPTGAVTWS